MNTVEKIDPLFTVPLCNFLLGDKEYSILNVKNIITNEIGHFNILINLIIFTVKNSLFDTWRIKVNIFSPRISIIIKNINNNNNTTVKNNDFSISCIAFFFTLYILFAVIIIAFVALEAKNIADIIIISIPKPEYEKSNNGTNKSLVLSGTLNTIKSTNLSKEIEKAFVIIAINNKIGIIESNKKKDRCPGKTETTGFLETS